jgi:hypothetical protein
LLKAFKPSLDWLLVFVPVAFVLAYWPWILALLFFFLPGVS